LKQNNKQKKASVQTDVLLEHKIIKKQLLKYKGIKIILYDHIFMYTEWSGFRVPAMFLYMNTRNGEGYIKIWVKLYYKYNFSKGFF